MYDELIKKLRNAVRWYEYGMPIVPSICIEAADAIEELIGELRKAGENGESI